MTFPSCVFDDGLDSRALARVLGVDERTLTTLTGAPVRAAHAISSFRRMDSPRQSFRVDLVDGEIRKIRRAMTAATAARMMATTAMLPAEDVARVLNVHGTLVVEEWVHGTPLDRVALSGDVLRHAGALLGRVHTTATANTTDLPSTRALDDIRSDLDVLAQAGDLGAPEAEAILALAAGTDPGTAARGLIHRDFCGENLVRRDDGSLCSIDNEDLGEGWLDADVVRAWQRWNLDGGARERFLSGYQAYRRPRLGDGEVVFWSIWSRALSARVRRSAHDHAASATHAAALVALTQSRPSFARAVSAASSTHVC